MNRLASGSPPGWFLVPQATAAASTLRRAFAEGSFFRFSGRNVWHSRDRRIRRIKTRTTTTDTALRAQPVKPHWMSTKAHVLHDRPSNSKYCKRCRSIRNLEIARRFALAPNESRVLASESSAPSLCANSSRSVGSSTSTASCPSLTWSGIPPTLLATIARLLYMASVTVSAADGLAEKSSEEIARVVWQDVAKALQDEGAKLPPHRVIKEKRATFSQTPASLTKRPSQVGPLENLFLAGDWTQTYIPATIESAVRSGLFAAQFVMQQLKLKDGKKS